MNNTSRGRSLGYEVQHIFAREIATRDGVEAEAAKQLLDSIGFDLESRSNKIALLINPEMLTALKNAPSYVWNAEKACEHGVPGARRAQ